MARHKEKIDLLSENFQPEKVRPAYKPDKAAPLIKVIQSNEGFVAGSREINVTNKNGGESRMPMPSSLARLVYLAPSISHMPATQAQKILHRSLSVSPSNTKWPSKLTCHRALNGL